MLTQALYSASFHTEVFLGDEQVYNTTISPCDECVGLRPYYNIKSVINTNKNISTNRVKRQQNLPEPLPPYDGNLDINSNYTGFVEIIGKFYN